MKGKLKTYFKIRGFFDYRRGWDKGTCLYCGSEDKAGVHVGRNFYHCFVCEEKGPLHKVVMEVEEITSVPKLYTFLETLTSSSYVSYDKLPPRAEMPTTVLPEGYTNIRRGSGEIPDRARAYVEKRGIPIEVAAKAGVGYTHLQKNKYFGRIVIPFKRSGKVVYFQGRSFLRFEPKILNPDWDETGLGKSQVIFNEGALLKPGEVNILESVFNVLTLYPNSVGLNGKVASHWQLSQLQAAKSPSLYNIILDNDAWEYAKKLALELIKYRPIRLTKLGPIDDDRDINDLGTETSLGLIRNCPILKSNFELRTYIKKLDEDNNKQRRLRILI